MCEVRTWAKVARCDGEFARYVIPTPCAECTLEIHHWFDEDNWETFVVFPRHGGTFWYRFKQAWHYLRTGYLPNDICLEPQDVANLRDVLSKVIEQKGVSQ